MAKIGFFIMSANQDLFCEESKILKEYYHKVIDDKKYDIELYSFTSDENSDKVYEDGDTIYCPCDDRNTFLKNKLLYDYIIENKHYDKILITNTSTLINFDHMYDFILKFNQRAFCCSSTARGIMCHPQGNVRIMPFEVLKAMNSVFQGARDALYPFWKFLYGDWPYRLKDMSDDAVTGIALFKLRIPWLEFPRECYGTLYKYHDSNIVTVNDWNRLYWLTFRMVAYENSGNEINDGALEDSNYRLSNEPTLLKNIIEKIQQV